MTSEQHKETVHSRSIRETRQDKTEIPRGGTFGFHPMLGFTQVKQSASIVSARKQFSGMCWYRNEVCPFSEQGIQSGAFPSETRVALTMIHSLCGKPSTHSS